ncbi:MAG: hypothetical protein AB7S78_07475 [Candidatus Omnitrophota bacterium]
MLSLICSYGFILLCLLHLFSQRPLWLDEDFVFQNIIHLDYAELFGPLKPAQSFPRVYLSLIKWIGAFFDNHVMALRFLPFLCMLSSFFLWRKIYDGLPIRKEQGHFILLLFSWLSSYWMVYYSAELKPYSMDVLAVGLYTLFFVHQDKIKDQTPDRWMIICSGLIPLLIFFSYACVFVFWIAVYNFLYMSFRNKKIIPVFLLNSVISLACFLLFYWTDIRHSITTAGVDYWESYFLCTDSPACFFSTFGEGVKRFSVFWWGTQKFFRRAAVIFIPLFLYGLVRWGGGGFRKERFKITTVDSLSLVLFIEFIMLGLLHKYPFTGQRITLFYAPFVFYLVTRTLLEARRIKYLGNVLYFYYIGYCCSSLGVSVWMYLQLYK